MNKQTKDPQKPHDNLKMGKKGILKNQTSFCEKNTQHTRSRRQLPQPGKWHIQKMHS